VASTSPTGRSVASASDVASTDAAVLRHRRMATKQRCHHSRPYRRGREGHHPCGRHRLASAPRHPGHVETTAAGVRQADDLLPAVGAHAGGPPRGARDHHAGGPSSIRAAARRRLAVGHPDRVCHPGLARRARPGIPDRRRVPRRSGRVARPRRQPVLRRRILQPRRHCGGPPLGRHRVRLPRQGPAAIRHRRPRRRRAPHQDRGEAQRADEQLGGHRALLLRRACRRGGSTGQAIGPG
jgi:hypothetical protein